MKTEGRMNLIREIGGISSNMDSKNRNPEDRREYLARLETSRISGPGEFERLFNEAVERQQSEKAEIEQQFALNNEQSKSVIQDDAFADIDKELGF